jgi:hypothetical protein
MKKEDALQAILAAWRSLPEGERQTESQLVAFAMKTAHDPEYSFRCSGDRYQHVMGYLNWNVSGLKKQGL